MGRKFYTTDNLENLNEKEFVDAIASSEDFYWGEDGADIQLFESLRMTKDLKEKVRNIKSITKSEIRTLVNTFYQIQDIRKAVREQIRAIEQGRSTSKIANTEGNVALLGYVFDNVIIIEKGIKTSLKFVVESRPEGRWLMQIDGIAEVLAAGLLGYFDIEKARYASNFISYAGLNSNNRPWIGVPGATKIINEVMGDDKKITAAHIERIAARTQWKVSYLNEHAMSLDKKGNPKWNKNDLIKACAKIPYNKGLKTHLYKVAKSFEYRKNNPKCYYGRLLAEKHAKIIAKNECKGYAELAAKQLAEKNYSKGTVSYQKYIEGYLPDAHIQKMAYRWIEKILVSHLFEEMYRVRYNKMPERYYALEHCKGKHNNFIRPQVPFDHVPDEELYYND